MAEFTLIYEGEELDEKGACALQKALGESVDATLPLALEVIFVTEEEIRRLNADTRGIDKVTDVLSYPTLDNIKGKRIKGEEYPFEIDEEGRLVIGSVAVCVQRAKQQAIEYGHSFERELNYLIVHGAMHCLGYDHMEEEDKKEMREKEESVLTKMGVTREE